MAEDIACPKCESKMVDMQACHMFCPNCGAHLDCSDKGKLLVNYNPGLSGIYSDDMLIA